MSDQSNIPLIRDRLDLPRWLVQKGILLPIVEVGTLFGEYAEHLLEYFPGTVHVVDPWENQPVTSYCDGCNAVNLPNAYLKTLARLERFGDRAVFHRKYSLNAALHFDEESLGAVFVDSNHSYESAQADIAMWYRKVVKGGIVAGHDFYNRHDDWHDCGVQQAVEEFCAEMKLEFYTTECTSWWIHKP